MQYLTYIVVDESKPGKFTSPFCSFLFQPVYVGKGTVNRVKNVNRVFSEQHAKPHAGKLFHCWLLGEKNKGRTQVHIVTLTADNETIAFSQEEILIDVFGLKLDGGLLLNARRGGSGGWALSEDTKKKLSKANLGSKNPNWGKTWTVERRNKWKNTWMSKDRTRDSSVMQHAWKEIRRTYKIYENGNTHIISDLTKFCRDNGLPLSAFRKALKTDEGIVKSSKRKSLVEGWQIKYLD